MVRKVPFLLLAVVMAAACGKGAPAKKGPLVAEGSGITISADELKARLDEQSPIIRARFNTLERKKEFLDNMIRFELLAKAAEKEGFANDPDVLLTMKKVMVSKYYQKFFQAGADAGKDVPEADVKKYFDEHPEEFHRPGRIHVAHVFFKADQSSPDRAKKGAEAKKILAKILADEKKNPSAFTLAARESSEDVATKPLGGDLSFKSKDELEKAFGGQFAAIATQLKDNETAASVIESPQGLHLVHVYGRQPEMNRPFEEAKGQIASRLGAQKKTKDFDDFVKKLRADAGVKIDDKALEAVPVSGPPSPGGPGLSPHGNVPVPAAPAGAAPPAAPAR